MTSNSSSNTLNSDPNRIRIDLQTPKNKVEVGEHYFTTEEIDAIWWDGYEQGSLDSAYSAFDQGYASAIDDYDLYYREGREK